MFHISSNAQLFLCGRFVKPVFALYVVSLLFLRGERRCLQGQKSLWIEMSCECGCSEECFEVVFFLSVKVDLERFGVIEGAKFRFTVLRLEVVMIVGDIAHHVKAPSLVGAP